MDRIVGSSMSEIESSLATEMSKKTVPPPFERIPTTTPDRSSNHRVLSDIMVAMRDGTHP
ncbi:MAG: hypothetical protein ABGY96_22985 [bacterium]|nr:hypothetical protein [Pseudomonadales bacterium]